MIHPSQKEWDELREYEQHRLKSIKVLTNDEILNIDRWLLGLHHVYEELRYPMSSRVSQATKYLRANEKAWYERNKSEVHEDWIIFCKRLKQYVHRRFQDIIHPPPPSSEQHVQPMNGRTRLEQRTRESFVKYSGEGDGEAWLLQTMSQFKRQDFSRFDQLQSIPFLLEDASYLWYVKTEQSISSFEIFSKTFLRRYSTSPTSSSENNVSLASSLSITMAREIIKSPSYFRGSKDDVIDWLEKLEQRFKMAHWSDENKLQYISIHLQDDAYRWWNQASTSITSWSSFVQAIKQAFGSTKMKELALEQFKWYKQTVNQPMAQYYAQVLELCKKVDADMTESMKLQYLLAGVKDSLKLHIALHDPPTPETFLACARKVEDTLSLTGSNYDVPPVDVQQDVIMHRQPMAAVNHSLSQAISIIVTNRQLECHHRICDGKINKFRWIETISVLVKRIIPRHRNDLDPLVTAVVLPVITRGIVPKTISSREASFGGVVFDKEYQYPSIGNNTPLLYISTCVGDLPMNLMIDTGATRAFIKIKCFNAMKETRVVNQQKHRVSLADDRTDLVA